MPETPENPKQSSHSTSAGWSKFVITAVALLVFLVRLFVNEELFERIDLIALGLLAVAAMPWVSSFVEEFKIPGVLEAKLRAIEAAAKEAETAAKDAVQQLDLERPMAPQAMASPSGGTGGGALSEGLYRLGETYVATRERMGSGNERTAEMTRIFREMMTEARRIGPDQPMALDGLSTNDAGRQLASIAYAYELPDQAEPSALISTVRQSRQPFVQYWGLMALRKQVKIFGPTQFSADDMASFTTLKHAFRKGTDRAWVYRQIEDQIG